MFLGEYQHSVDEKGRIVMPAKFRERLEAGAVVTKGQERCLYVFPQDRWADEVAKVSRLPRTNRRNRDYARAFFGGASDLQMDKQGRLPIPQPLRSFAGLDKDVVVVGVSDRLEIWDAVSWQSLSSQADELYAGIEEALSEEGI
ncbi:MAG TPA: division/cell wall cluster transcriptional repressor MraZ [Acidimicrobiia bacterium]|nr:division/cell wall cluster transcriptional repressor MraZ [Acidimicrobiia bacterium]